MKALIVLVVITVLVVIIFRLADRKWRVGVIWRGIIMKLRWEGPFPFKELEADPLSTAACTDLGAFKKPLQNLGAIETIIIMEDRSPEFFLSYEEYKAEKQVPLNRHGPLKQYSTQKDLQILVQKIHAQGKKVVIGFWGFWGDLASGPTEWLKRHPELKPRQRDESDIGNPFAVLQPENISFASYIAKQYDKLHRDFGFDGLFLGDGLSGFRTFFYPERYRNKGNATEQWASFYKTIAETIHKNNGQLWAYDCMGFSYNQAQCHGADYWLLGEAGLDVLIFQTYPTAWAHYFLVPGKSIDLSQDLKNLRSVKQALAEKIPTRIYYSCELGDEVERWLPRWKTTRTQMKTFQAVADGKFLVWANNLLSQL